MNDILSHLPILIVMIPISTAFIGPLAGYLFLGWIRRIALLGLLINLICSLLLVLHITTSGPFTYHLAGVAPPLGIAFYADYLGACISVLISGIAFISIWYSSDSIEELGERKSLFFYVLLLLSVGAMQGTIITADLFTLFILFEILAIVMYGLVAIRGDGRGLLAGYKYLLIGSAGSAMILIGIGFLYITTGTLNMHMMADLLVPVSDSYTVLAGLALLIAGISTKIGLFPLHIWMPDAYAYAPSIAPVFSTLALKAGLVALIRVIFIIFGPSLAVQTIPLYSMLAILGAVAIIFCSVLAIRQVDIRKMFAYSTGANIGCVVLGIGIATEAGLEGAILLMITHATAKAGLFLCADTILIQAGIRYIHEFRGLGMAMPYTMAAFAMAALSMIGIPLSGGFVSKIIISSAAIASDLLLYAIIILFWTLLTAVYFFRILNSAYFEEADRVRTIREAPINVLIPIYLLCTAAILLGIFVEVPMGIIRPAAALLLGGRG
ncbi:MAG: proton-conducting transporter membrane subunit [Methanocalculus sp.]|uniref:proton-conducting transporter transmembrane domain-containing protein n=1 Tax=Methanocalculus sp. TaxID=2004547 RepID=UPI00271DF1E0|nr:proton-conducting transporter membrane subunit [Methanocalculus sp.]MDO9538980.1 proton-conducting transporter membrane subunit [Methanocalculus sp.]